MNKIKILTQMLHLGSFMILITAIGETIRRIINWLKGLGRPQELHS